MNDIYNEIKEKLKSNNIILFIGAGVPATLQLPTWGQLIDAMAQLLEYEPPVFKELGDYLSLAEFFSLKEGNLTKLQLWMSENCTVSDEKIKNSDIYNTITSMNCKLIYTTNYDHTLESAFKLKEKPVKRIVSVSDLVGISDSDTLLVKFHGDMEYKESIVVSESNYFKRLNFESALDIRLRSDMLGKSILFIGYSLSDINIRFLLYKLDQLWKESNTSDVRPKSYIFLAKPDHIQDKILGNRGITPIFGTSLDETESLKDFLKQISSN